MSTQPRRPVLIGLSAGAVGVAVALVVGAGLGQRTNVVSAVAEAVRDLTPGSIAVPLVHLVGRADKPLLIVGVLLGLVLLSGWAGASRRGGWVFAGLGALAVAAAVTRPGADAMAALPALVGTGVSLAALRWLRSLAPQAHPPATDRRRFLGAVGAVWLGSALLVGGSRILGQGRRSVESVRAALGRSPRGRVPAGADLDVPGLSPWRISNRDFYRIDTALSVPEVLPDDWRLRIHGMVDRSIELTYADLLARERTEAWITIGCVSNSIGGDLIGNAYWSGVRIAPLLAEAGVAAGADAVLQTSVDGWTCGTPLSVLSDGRDAMLALAMNGEPLPVEHGFPVRCVVPGLYGFVSATKWITDLEVTRFDRFSAYWTRRGWSPYGPVKTQSRIEVPRDSVPAGDVQVAGTAWAQHRGVARVEVRVDGGPWVPCELGAVPGADTWVQWRATVPLAKGNRQLTVRATDGAGVTQPSHVSNAAPDGATGWHSVWVTAH